MSKAISASILSLRERRQARQGKRHGERGFTLVEMLVVITIIGLIMGLVGPRVLNYLGESKAKAAKIQMRVSPARSICSISIPAVIRRRRRGLRRWSVARRGVGAWNGPYLRGGDVPTDPWDHPYVYRAPGQRGAYDIVSYGADGREGGSGTAADLSLDTMTSARNE